jgi:carboxyl-terminal processing protease
MSQRNALILLASLALCYACYLRADQNPYARYVAEGLRAIDQGSLEPVPGRELFGGAMDGMVQVLRRHGDAHSQFLPEEEADPLRTEIRQQFGGIGVRLSFEEEPRRLVIAAPPDPGSPAARAQLLPGDHILMIDDQPTSELTMLEVIRRMRGQPGTKLRLTVQHKHQSTPRTVELIREIIHIESILGDRRRANGTWEYRLEEDPRIAHVRIALFGDRTVAELNRTLEELTKGGVEAVVLDMRDNAGGALDAAVAVCKLFLPKDKLIVETRGRRGQLLDRYETSRDGKYLHLPLAVLVNHNSASAAEIVAACLQDHGRAVVFGERTFGKGTVQQLTPLESGRSLLKLTWASFWRPNGSPIQRTDDSGESSWGVAPEPQHELRLSPEDYATYRKYRTARDLLVSSETTVESEAPDTGDFSDKQLRLVLEFLGNKLENR